MSTPPPNLPKAEAPTASSNNSIPSADLIDLLKFLGEESRNNREALRNEANSVRDLFVKTSAIVAIPLTVAIALAGILFVHNLNEMKDQMVEDGKAQAALEINKMDGQIDQTLQSEFAAPKIQRTIHQAAENATREQAPALIKSVITPEVRDAVARQSGTIKQIAVKAVDEKVDTAVAPLANQARESLNALHIQELIAEANSDDADAFDELMQFRGTGSTDQNTLINNIITERRRTISERIYSRNGAGPISHCQVPRVAFDQFALRDFPTRQEILANCIAWAGLEKSRTVLPDQSEPTLDIELKLAPIFVRIATQDHSLAVRALAVHGLNDLFLFSPHFPPAGLDLIDKAQVKTWWEENSSSARALKLLSSTSPPGSDGADSVYLYDQLSSLAARDNASLEPLIRGRLAEIRASSAPPEESKSELESHLGRRDCADVERDSLARIADWYNHPEIDFEATMEFGNSNSCGPAGQIPSM